MFDGGFNFHDKLVFNTVWPLIVGVFIMSFVLVADKMPKAFPTLVAVRSVVFVIFLHDHLLCVPSVQPVFNAFPRAELRRRLQRARR